MVVKFCRKPGAFMVWFVSTDISGVTVATIPVKGLCALYHLAVLLSRYTYK
jgi:hypothetical protein